MKYIPQPLLAATFFLALLFGGNIFAGPEKYDHLGEFKNETVNNQGPAREVVIDAEGKKIAEAVYYYNKKNQIEKVEYWKGSASDGRSLYIYDDNGLAEERLVNAAGELMERLLYQRDREKNVVSYSVYDRENEKILTWKFAYDKGRLVSGVRFSGQEITERFERVYKAGQIITTLFNQNNEIAGTITSTITNGKVTRRSRNDLTGLYRIDYTYDQKGRLTGMTFYEDRGRGEKKIKNHQFSYAPGGGVMTRDNEPTPQSAMKYANLHESDQAHPAQR